MLIKYFATPTTQDLDHRTTFNNWVAFTQFCRNKDNELGSRSSNPKDLPQVELDFIQKHCKTCGVSLEDATQKPITPAVLEKLLSHI